MARNPSSNRATETLDEATRLHSAGIAAAAERLCLRLIADNPGHADGFHLLGVVALQTGRPDVAASAIGRAVVLMPDIPGFHMNRGNALRAGGLSESAFAAYRLAVVLQPDSAEFLFNLALAADETRRGIVSVALYQRALAFRPDDPNFHLNLGLALVGLARRTEADERFLAALVLAPDLAAAYFNLAADFLDAGNDILAVAGFRRAVHLDPVDPESHNNLGFVRARLGHRDRAIEHFHATIALAPDRAAAYYNLAKELLARLDVNSAIAGFRRARCLDPTDPEVHNNLGLALQERGQRDDAATCYRATLCLNPASPEGQWNLALTRLASGDYTRGWAGFEWRWRGGIKESVPQVLPRPLWDGQDVQGRTLLVYTEQGNGDTFQFVRFLPLLRAQGARVIFVCMPRLARLLRTVPGRIAVVAKGDPIPDYDYHLPLMSLPHRLGITLESLPGVPYLRPESERSDAWRRRFRSSFNVGVAWRGNPNYQRDRQRSIDVGLMGRLLDIPGVTVVSLQADARTEELAALGDAIQFEDEGFVETAAVINNLDLVLSVDTAIGHLAGALGARTWALLDYTADWRWLTGRTDSPWYPTMRLYRQPSLGDWDAVVDVVREDLIRLVRRERSFTRRVRALWR